MPDACTAGVIATPDPESCPITGDVTQAAEWLDERDYDSAPVYEDGRPIGYVTRDAVVDTPVDVSLDDVIESLTVDVLIAGDAPLDDVLEALYERPFYYLADRSEVTGVLTRADLNTEPVYQHLYTKLSRLEQVLRETILEHAPEWQETAPIPPDVLDDIESRLADAKAAGVALDPIHYAQFSTLVTIVASSERCSEALGFDAGHQASSRLSAVTELRNDVAHSTPILQNTEQGLTESGRTVTNLLDQYSLIDELLAVQND